MNLRSVMKIDRDRRPVAELVDLDVQHKVLDFYGAAFLEFVRDPSKEERDVALAVPQWIGEAEVSGGPGGRLVHRPSMSD